jgi:hypothetical protein
VLNLQLPKIEGFEPKSNVVISCQKHKLKPIFTDYIYRIISSKKQKDKPYQMDLPLLKNGITGSELTVKILDT